LPDNPLFNNIGSNVEFRADFQPFYNQMAVFQANSGPKLLSCGLSIFTHQRQKIKNFQNFS